MFVCTICCLGTESNMYKRRELKNKAELKDRKARCIKPVWLKIIVFSEKYKKDERGGMERVENEGLFCFCYIIE